MEVVRNAAQIVQLAKMITKMSNKDKKYVQRAAFRTMPWHRVRGHGTPIGSIGKATYFGCGNGYEFKQLVNGGHMMLKLSLAIANIACS
jgi:hypothetical protein